MAVRIVRLGTPRSRDEGLRLGTVRRLPRGVRKADYARRDFFDLWLPELAPSTKLFAFAMKQELTSQRWRKFAAAYRREMSQPAPQRLIAVLAALSHQANLSVGCYCEDESRCHRSLLRGLLVAHGAKVT
ncbi:MAG TPA: DUF488 family protein [Burkholderiales bacterium]|nr:DUF488 family protein [Burkholderiales bacterium]